MRRSRDVKLAMKGVPRIVWTMSRSQVARSLWEFGEDDLAERALSMSEDDLFAICRIAVVYRDPDYPLPAAATSVSGGHAAAFAAVAFFEGRLRPLKQYRRRPKKDLPERFTPHIATPGDGDPHAYHGTKRRWWSRRRRVWF